MSYAILRIKKMKQQAIKGIQFHNQRERESKTNPDIEEDKTHLNYDLVNQKPVDYTERINSIIEEGVNSDKKIRKDAVRLTSMMITSDKEFFDGLSEEDEKRYFESSLEFLKEKYGEENIAYAMVHKDEKTPHMHVGLVPITKDGRLSAKDLFGGKVKMHELQNEFYAHVKENGFDLDRGESSDRKHIEMHKFKQQTLQQENQVLDSKLKTAEEQLKEFGKLIERIEEIKPDIQSVEEIETKKVPFRKDQIIIKTDDFENLSQMAQKTFLRDEKGKTLAKEVNALQRENKSLSEDLEKEKNKSHLYEQKNRELREKNRELQRENRQLLHRFKDLTFVVAKLKEIVQAIKDKFKEMDYKEGVAFIQKKEDQIEKNRPSRIYKGQDMEL